ncbi:hypothetical protein ACSXCW_12565 [Clostridium perfringens]
MNSLALESTFFLSVTNEKFSKGDQGEGFSILSEFTKFFAKEEYFKKILEIIKEKDDCRRNEKEMKFSLPVYEWINKENSTKKIYKDMLIKYEKYSNPGIYQISYSKNIEKEKFKNLLLLFDDED